MANSELVIKIKTLIDNAGLSSQVSAVKKQLDKINFSPLGKELKDIAEGAAKLDFKGAVAGAKQVLSIISPLQKFKMQPQMELQQINAQMRDLAAKMRNAVKLGIDDTALKAEFQKLKQTKIDINAKLNLATAGDGFANIKKDVKDAEKNIVNLGTTSTGTFSKIKNGVSNLATFGLAAQGVQVLASGIKSLSQPVIDLETAIAKVKTLGGDAKALAPTLKTMVVDMAEKVPISAAEIATASYDALSAGIKASEKDMKAFMDASAQLAVGGSETIGNSVNVLSSLLNAYGLDASKTTQITDELFTTINLGKTTLPELSSSLSQVIPTAAGMGLSLKNVGASLALMTANGVPTAQAVTSLNAMLVEIQKPGSQLSKILRDAGLSVEGLGEKIKSGDFVGVLGDLQGAFNKAGVSVTQAFSSVEASKAANVLLGNLDKMKDTVGQFDKAAGATNAAYNEMTNTTASKIEQFKAKLQNIPIAIASSIGEPMLKVFSSLLDGIMPAIKQIATALAPVMSELVGVISSVLSNLAPIITQLLSSLAPVITPLITLIQNLITALMPIIDVLVTSLSPVISDVVELVSIVVDVINPLLPIIGLLTASLLQSLLIPLIPVIRLLLQVVTLLLMPIKLLIGLFAAVIEPVAQLMTWIMKLTSSIFQVPFNWLSGGLQGVSKAIENVIKFIRNIVGEIVNFGKSILQFFGIIDEKQKAPLKLTAPLKVETGDVNKEINQVVDDTNEKIQSKPITPKVSGGSIIDVLAAYKQLQKEIEIINQLQELQGERDRLISGRAKNIYDEVAAYERQASSLNKLNDEFQKYIDKYKITLDEKTGQISFEVKLDKQNKQAVSDEFLKLKTEIEKNENLKIELDAKVKLNEQDYYNKLKELEEKELDLKIKMGVVNEDVKLDLIKEKYKQNTDELNNYEKAIEQLEIRKNGITTLELATLQDLRDKYIATRSKQIELSNQLYDAEQKKAEKTTKLKLQLLDEEAKKQKQNSEDLIKFYERVADYSQEVIKNNIDLDEEAALDALEKQKENELITESEYQSKKLKLQQYYKNLELVQEKAHQASLAEIQRQQELKTLKNTKQQLEIELQKAYEEGNDELVIKLMDKLDVLEQGIKDKSNILTTVSKNMGDAVAMSLAGMFDGREEDLKKPWRVFFAVTASALKTQVESLIIELALKELQKMAIFSGGLGALLLLPVVTGVLRGAMDALLNPVLSSIASFSAGGRVDEPTIAIVGDASKARPGRDTEWILRDDQIETIMQKVVNVYARENEKAMKLIVKDITITEYFKIMKDSQQKQQSMQQLNLEKVKTVDVNFATLKSKDVIKFTKIDLSPLERLQPKETQFRTDKIEKLLSILIQKIDEKNVTIELDGEKITKKVNSYRNKMKYL